MKLEEFHKNSNLKTLNLNYFHLHKLWKLS